MVSRHRENLVLGLNDPSTSVNENSVGVHVGLQVDHLRNELGALSHKRSALEVITRNLIADTKQEYRDQLKDDSADKSISLRMNMKINDKRK